RACHAAAVATAANSSSQSSRDQFGGTRQDRVRFNPDCIAEPRVSFSPDKDSEVAMAPFTSWCSPFGFARICLHFLPKEKRTRNCRKSAEQRRKDECRCSRFRGERHARRLELPNGSSRFGCPGAVSMSHKRSECLVCAADPRARK